MFEAASHAPDSGSRATPGGFRASIEGASLPDLIQMECLAQSSSVFRVTSDNKVGYLYFRGGQLVHAWTGEHTGEAAVLEILKWHNGTFDPCSVQFPEAPSIRTSWQHLLLRSAQNRDESGRHKLVSFSKPPHPSAHKAGSETTPEEDSSPPRPSAPPASERSLELAVRLDARGNVLSSRGDVSEFAELVAYTSRLAQLIGADLGMDALVSAECTCERSRYLLHVEESGQLLALKAAKDADLTSVRARFGL
ncbi:MAG TPA: DUF4388 domain-containing protein [Polyangiaceae bacterium]|nr:DUF4388 domain-containing protein [Polyangiaceae bacterium]